MKIPQPLGQEEITRQPLATRAQPGVFSTAVSQAGQKFAETFAAVSQQFEEIQSLAEKTKADTEVIRKFGELSLEARETSSIEDITKFKNEYKNKITKIREEANKSITLPQAKNEFNRSFDRDAVLFDFEIRSTLRTNQNEASEVILNDNITELRNVFITGNVQRQFIAETKFDSLLTEAVNRGVLIPKAAKKLKAGQVKEWRLAKIDVDIENDAKDASEQLALGKKGIYADTSAGDRLTKLTKAETKLKRNEKIAKKLTNEKHSKNELELTQKFFNKQLEFSEIQEQFDNGDISEKYAGILNTVLTSPDAIDAETDEEEFNKLLDIYNKLDESNLDDLRQYNINVLSRHANGFLNRNDAGFLINKTVDPFTQQKADGKGFMAATIETLGNWARTFIVPEPDITAKLIRKFINRVDEKATEEEITKAGQDVIKEERKELNPSIANTDEKGTIMMDASGNKARVFPDGRIEEIE